MIISILIWLAETILSPGIAAMVKRWLSPKPPEDGFQADRKADDAAKKADKESPDNDPNRLPPNP